MLDNEVLCCIRDRRSTRVFKDCQIEDAQLDELLNAAVWAPSGGNNQTWLFTAIQSKEKLLHLNTLVREGFQRWVPDDGYPSKLAAKERSANPDYNFYFHAPTLIIASNRPQYANAMADCALAMQNIFLAAQSIGLGSCYVNQLHWLENDPHIRAYLFEMGIPTEHVICAAAAIGCIAVASAAPARKGNTIQIIR